MNNLQHFKYNVKTGRVSESYQYGSDSNGNINSLMNIACYYLTDGNDKKLGHVNFDVSGSTINATTDYFSNPQLYNEFGSFHVDNVGTFTYNIAFKADSAIFNDGLVIPTIISATGVYYNKVEKISIKANSDGSRDVWISLKK